MQVRFIKLKDANAFFALHETNHEPVTRHCYSLACYAGERLCGVVIVDKPHIEWFGHKAAVEVLRFCTDGTRDAYSQLYSAARRAAAALGYKRLTIHIRDGDSHTAPGRSSLFTVDRCLREGGL